MMSDYHINIFYSEEDEGYIADIPDLNACSAFGETRAEALAEVDQAKELWLAAARDAGKPIPPPRYRPLTYDWAGDSTEAVAVDKRQWFEMPQASLWLATVFMTLAALVALAGFNAPTEAFLATAVAGVSFGLLEIVYGQRKRAARPGNVRSSD